MCYLLAFPTRVGVKVDIYLLQQSIFSLLLQRIFTCPSMSREMEESSSNSVVFRLILIFRESLFLEFAKPSFYAIPYSNIFLSTPAHRGGKFLRYVEFISIPYSLTAVDSLMGEIPPETIMIHCTCLLGFHNNIVA